MRVVKFPFLSFTANIGEKESLSLVIDESPQQAILKRKASGDIAPLRVAMKTTHVAHLDNRPFPSFHSNNMWVSCHIFPHKRFTLQHLFRLTILALDDELVMGLTANPS